MTTKKILEAIKQSIHEGKQVKVDLTEASAITGSGSGVGGNVVFDDAFAALRYANPFRMGSRVVPVKGSDMQFVAKTGNATNQAGNPWGYPVANNVGSPNTDTTIWQLPLGFNPAIKWWSTEECWWIVHWSMPLKQQRMLHQPR